MSESPFYSFTAKTLEGQEILFEEFRGKTVLVVNTASKCGLTPQYEGLESLYLKYKENGLEILGFPCNQFAGQEPGDAEAIKQTCLNNYGITFRMFEKIEVNGDNAHPLYKYLKKEQKGLLGSAIKWNFTKFLINAEGKPIARFAPTDSPDKIDAFLEKHFNQSLSHSSHIRSAG